MIAEFINTYGVELLNGALVAIFGWLGAVAKKLFTKFVNTKIKKELAKTVVQFVEQVYKDLHGEEKLNAAMSAFSELLAEEGIHVSEIEMRMLLEATVAEFNDAFNKSVSIDPAKAVTE